jgi:hypothetical protein
VTGRPASVAWTFGAPALLVLACSGGNESPRTRPWCPTAESAAAPDVAGTYRYLGPLRGSITLEQTGTLVRLVDTTYDNADDRPLIGEGTLEGNVLQMRMVPENGETDYDALVNFVFDATGDRFCVQFSDTNGDRGALGSYTGRRQ